MLQPEQRGHQIGERLFRVRSIKTFVDQQKSLIWLKAVQPFWRGLNQKPVSKSRTIL